MVLDIFIVRYVNTVNQANFIVGKKTTENIKPIIDKLLLLKPKRIYTDRLNIYPSLIPKEIHKRFQYYTNRIEQKISLIIHIKNF